MKSKSLKIAQYIYNKGYKSNLQINKLLYIAFGFYGATYDKYLFDSNIEAWKYGPVVPIVYNAFNFGFFETQNYANEVLSSEEKKIIDEVLSFYGKKAPFLLVELTHQPDTPWSKHYIEGAKNIEIKKTDIITYYKDFLSKSEALIDIMSTDKFKDIMKFLAKT